MKDENIRSVLSDDTVAIVQNTQWQSVGLPFLLLRLYTIYLYWMQTKAIN